MKMLKALDKIPVLIILYSIVAFGQTNFRLMDPDNRAYQWGKSPFDGPPYLYFDAINQSYEISDANLDLYSTFVDASFASWNSASPVQFSDSGGGVDVRGEWPPTGVDGPGWTYTATNSTTNIIDAANCYISLNKTYNWRTTFQNLPGGDLDIQSILTHEIGHILGIAHPLTWAPGYLAPTMAGGQETHFNNSLDCRSLEVPDINAAKFLQLRVPTFYSTITAALNVASQIGVGCIFLDSGTYNESFTISTDNITIIGAGKNSTTINGTVTFQDVNDCTIEDLTILSQVNVNSGTNDKLSQVNTDERIVINYGNNHKLYSVTANHGDKYGVQTYNTNNLDIRGFSATGSSKYAIYGSSSSNFDVSSDVNNPENIITHKTFAVQLTTTTSADLYDVVFCDNSYDIYNVSSIAATATDCIWSGDPANVIYGQVNYSPLSWVDCSSLN